MTTIRIWTLESDGDADAVHHLADRLKSYLQLGNLRIRSSSGSTLSNIQARARKSPPQRARKGAFSRSPLGLATDIYLKEDACVIFVIDQDSPKSSDQRRKEPNSYISQVHHVVNDSHFAGRVFLAPAVQELEAWLLIDCLGIFCYFASQRQRYRDNCRRKISGNRSFGRLLKRYQKGDTEKIVEPELGGAGPKEYLVEFSKMILRELNPNIPHKNVDRRKYRPAISPEVAEHVVIDGRTLRRNNSLRYLGELLAQFN